MKHDPHARAAPAPRTPAVDQPYDRLQALPRPLWLGTLVTASGRLTARLDELPHWMEALRSGELPAAHADFGDPEAVAPFRRVIGELELPAMCRGSQPATEQVLRTLLWHLDRLIDRPSGRERAAAIAEQVASFREDWTLQRAGWEEITALLLGLGELAEMRWDALQGRLSTREWATARELDALLARSPDIVELIRTLGAGLPRPALSRPAPQVEAAAPPDTRRVRRRITVMPGAPGAIQGVALGRSLARMVPAEAAELHHPVLHKLWRARFAESRLRVWDEIAEWVDLVPDPEGAERAPTAPVPRPRERGPFIVCVDTSGSMKGAPERLAKAVLLEAARTAHREQRACRLIAFGGPGEIVEWSLGLDASGLDALLAFIGQSFDGGTDIAAPIERALDAVHEGAWQEADVLLVSDGEFGVTPAVLQRLDAAREQLGLRVQGLLIGDRETLGLLEVCDAIHWVRDWRRYAPGARSQDNFSPVHSQSLTALYFPNALSPRAARHRR